MKRLFRWGVIAILALVIAGAGAGLWWRDNLVRLMAVNSLFDGDRIVANFSAMDSLFFNTPIARTGPTLAWTRQERPLVAEYRFGGQARMVEDWLAKRTTTSLVVIQDGVLVHEDYRLGTTEADRRISWSMAKSFLSAMFGMAVADGSIRSIDDPVEAYVPALKGSAYEGVTIRNVLTMASGVRFDESYLDFFSDINRMGRVLALGGSMDAFAAGLKLRERPQGTARQYTSIDTHVLAMVLRAATGKSTQDLFAEALWAKLGPEDDAVYLTDGYGVAFALGGLNLRSRDYARFGQMMLDHGRFNGVQVVPEGWADESVRPLAPRAAGAGDEVGYGYQWWVPLTPGDEFYAVGIYGQYIYVNRESRTVIVKTSADRAFEDDGARGYHIEAETIAMFRAIAAGLSGWANPDAR